MSRVRVGIIGAGSWSTAVHLPELTRHRDVSVEIVSSRELGTGERIGAAFSVPQVTTDWRDVVDAGLDAIIVSSPPYAHEAQAVAALSSGAHTLCEKPMALTSTAAHAMVSASTDAQRGLLVGFGWPFSALFAHAKMCLEADRIGEIEHVELRLHANIRELLTGTTELDWQRGGIQSEQSTYRDPAVSGGGALTTTLSHGIGMLSWLTGQSLDRVFATDGRNSGPLDLHLAIAGELADGASVSISCASTSGRSPGVGWYLAIIGSQGELLLDFSERTIRIDGKWSEVIRMTSNEAANRPGAPTLALLDVARGGTVPAAASGQLGALVVATTEAITESLQTGRPAQVDRHSLPPSGW
ncbi:MAG TPA: Gfo/Idh/MocA family oxidoreductase [Plantibacter sp.]|uniref:Gfo/Idh/MocA family protein n=1 Tax=unclassified Plantibacter TaxID=2624265 RepID=UPI002CB47AC2|nr:Gfo/Idh/MocA family oxidoreductase [Plantibacter sp.]